MRAELEDDETLTPVQRRNRVTNARRAATESRLAECVDWLCVFAPRDEIPESFRVLAVAEGPSASLRAAQSRVEDARDAAAATARDQTRRATCSGASASEESDAAAEDRAALAGTAAREDPHVALLQRAMLARLGAYGFTRAESREALERTGWTEQDATYVLLRKLHPKSESERDAEDADADADADAASALGERADEALALESIFEDAFVSEPSLWTVQIPADDPSSWRPCWLEIHFPPGDLYPKTPPLVSVRQPNVPPAIRRSVAAQLAALACGDLRGEPAVFALAEWLREYLPAILEEHGEMDEAAAARKAASAAEEEARREAEAAAEAANKRGFLAGHTKFERTFAKIEAERECEREEENRARERRAAYLRLLIASEGDEATGEGNDEKAGDSGAKKNKSGEDEDARDDAEEEDFVPTDAVEKNKVGGGFSDVSESPGPSSRDEDESSLDARLDRWEAEHARRVAAVRAKIRTNPFDFGIEHGAVIAPNTARTKEDERREEETRARAAASAAAAAAEAAALATARAGARRRARRCTSARART